MSLEISAFCQHKKPSVSLGMAELGSQLGRLRHQHGPPTGVVIHLSYDIAPRDWSLGPKVRSHAPDGVVTPTASDRAPSLQTLD